MQSYNYYYKYIFLIFEYYSRSLLSVLSISFCLTMFTYINKHVIYTNLSLIYG